MAGYSKRSLSEKLGLKERQKRLFIATPENYESLLGTSIKPALRPPFEFIQLFVRQSSLLKREFPDLRDKLEKAGMLWVSWPKGGSSIETDLNENIVREIGLTNGMVDVKVIAVNEDWSGLKFVFRLKDR